LDSRIRRYPDYVKTLSATKITHQAQFLCFCITYCSGFSLGTWLPEHGVSGNPDPLPDQFQSLLLEDHGIANMLKDNTCNRTTGDKYNTLKAINGWIKGKNR
jgi:hypothetical protein